MSRLDEHADIVPLACAVIATAAKDAQSKDAVKALDAVLFLTGDDMPIWLDALGLEHADPIALVTSGRLKNFTFGKSHE